MGYGYRIILENSYYGMLRSVEISSHDEPEILTTVKSLLMNPVEFENYDNKIFEKMLRKDKEIAKTYNFLGDAYFKNNELQKAKTNYEIALNIWPDFVSANKNLKNLNNLK